MAENVALAIFAFLLTLLIYLGLWQEKQDRRHAKEVVKRLKRAEETG